MINAIATRAALLALTCSAHFLVAGAAHAVSAYPAQGRNGMVASAHHIATDVGVSVLRAGGNAVDAAVAVGYALAVTLPQAGNLGGGGFMVVRMADGRETMIDFREAAALAATRNMFLDSRGNIAGDAGERSWLGVAVPGTVAGLEKARAQFGTQPLKALVQPAIRIAREGFVLGQWDDVVHFESMLTELSASEPLVKRYFMNNGRPYRVGERFKQPALAQTLSSIAQQGPHVFYRGWIADEIVHASNLGGGILSKADFAKYQALDYTPVRCLYRGHEIISSAPPSSGGTSVCETLNILEGFPLGESGYRSTANLHSLVESLKLAFADRNLAMGDPRFVNNPVERLTSTGYASELRSRVSATRAAPSSEISSQPASAEQRHTTHFSVVDRFGNAVAITYSLGTWFGTGKIAGKAGFFLNDTMIGFAAKVGAPNVYGLVQGEANAIAPEKRPLSSLAPTVILKDGKVFMVVGAAGGPRIISGTVQAISNVIDFGMSVKDAVDADRIHHQWLPDTVFVEGQAVPPDVKKQMQRLGHHFTNDAPKTVLNMLDAIMVDPESGLMTGAHDNREPAGSAAGLP